MENRRYIEEANQMLDKNSEREGKFLTLFIAKQAFGIPVCDVVQIVGMQAITEIPDSEDYLKGVLTIRGLIVPTIDLRLRLGKEEKKYDERTSIIIVLIENKEIGCIVDEVDSVIDIAEAQISEPPQMVYKSNQGCLSGIATVANNVVLLLNVSKLLSEDSMIEN